MKRDIIITALLVFCLTSTLFMILPTRSQEYDPWADLNEDGIVDIFDVVGVTSIYETTGDPAKNVNVSNWPVGNEINVWYGYPMSGSQSATSASYNASGFGYLHILAWAALLSGSESVTMRVTAYLYNENHTASVALIVDTFTLTATASITDVTIPVPNETFYFVAIADPTTSCAIFLSFYPTWS